VAFVAPVITIFLSSAILFYGMKFAPEVSNAVSSSTAGAD
jgi:hypothetical protein